LYTSSFGYVAIVLSLYQPNKGYKIHSYYSITFNSWCVYETWIYFNAIDF